MSCYPMRRARHARSARVRPVFMSALFSALAALSVLGAPPPGGSAPGPRLAIAVAFIACCFRADPKWRGRVAVVLAAVTAISLAAWTQAMDQYVATGREAWGNTMAGWLIAAAVAGSGAWWLRSRIQAEREAAITTRLDALLAEIRERRLPY